LAKVTYEGEPGPQGLLLLIKPTVCGDEPQDVRQYRSAHSTFPQETTADQFFDEAQWEAYRRLGEHVGTCLFDGPTDGPKWHPAMMGGRLLELALDAIELHK